MAKNSICYLCGRTELKNRGGKVRDNAELNILECLSCGLVFLSSFDHIQKDHYQKARMHYEPLDIETWLEVTERDDERRFVFLKHLIKDKSLLDFGCGAGGFLKRASSIATQVAGVEVEERLKPYFRKNGLKVFADVAEVTGQFDIVTLFHVLEHMKDPINTLRGLAEKLNEGGSMIVEVPSADDALLKLYENQPFSNFIYWSCHLFLFTNATIASVAEKSGLKLDYIKQVQRYPLANHLYWLAKGKPDGHKIWDFFDSEELRKSYENQLASVNLCDTIIASFSRA